MKSLRSPISLMIFSCALISSYSLAEKKIKCIHLYTQQQGNREIKKTDIIGVWWATDDEPSARFSIDSDSIYYVDSFKTYKYQLNHDTLTIYFDPDPILTVLDLKGMDTLILRNPEYESIDTLVKKDVSTKRTGKTDKLHSIPSQTLNLYQLIADSTKDDIHTIPAFEISELVTYREYKRYLASVKIDSSETFYISQLPDSGIGRDDVYREYIYGSGYDDNPVLGISWDNAMNYCKWKTLKENADGIRFVYRLPHCSEWLAARHYLSEKKLKNDFNKNYSDWLINLQDETPYYLNYESAKPFHYDRIYFHKQPDPRAMKRKLVIGNSYLYQMQTVLDPILIFYADEGYRHIGFRYVKEPVSETTIPYFYHLTLNELLSRFWGIPIK